jgi:hypothetical protein
MFLAALMFVTALIFPPVLILPTVFLTYSRNPTEHRLHSPYAPPRQPPQGWALPFVRTATGAQCAPLVAALSGRRMAKEVSSRLAVLVLGGGRSDDVISIISPSKHVVVRVLYKFNLYISSKMST